MISANNSDVTTAVILKKEETDAVSPRILELRKKIRSREYIDNAIQRIAQVISSHLIENSAELKFRN